MKPKTMFSSVSIQVAASGVRRVGLLVVFFVSFVAANAQTTISNFYRPGKIGLDNGKPVTSDVNSNWVLEPVEGYFRIKNTNTGDYLHNENRVLTSGKIQPGMWSAMWQMKGLNNGTCLIVNRYTGEYLHVERGPLELSKIGSEAWNSAYWWVSSNVPAGRLSKKGKHVYMDPILVSKDVALSGDAAGQAATLLLNVTPNIHIGKSGKQYLIFDMGASQIKERRANGIKDNGEFVRGWFYESAKVTIYNTQNVRLVQVPTVSNNAEGVMTSSIEDTFGGNIGAGAEGASGGLEASTTSNKTYSRVVKGFTLDAPSAEGGTAIHYIHMTGSLDGGAGGIVPYDKPVDLSDLAKYNSFGAGFASVFTTQAFYGFKLNGLTDPALGKGMYLPVQAVYEAPATAKGMVTFNVEISVTLRKVFCEGHTKFDAKVKNSSQTVSFKVPVSVNLDMSSYGPM